MSQVIFNNSNMVLSRSTAVPGQQVVLLNNSPASIIFYLDGTGSLQSFTASYLPVTCSSADTASFLNGFITSASFATTALSASFAPGSNPLNTGSTYPITSSWANNVVSASFASGFPKELFTASLYQITASWASNAVAGGTQLATGSLVPITSSRAISASWAPSTNALSSSVSISASYASQSAFSPFVFQNVAAINGNLIVRSDLGTGSWFILNIHDDGSGSFTTQLTPTTNTGSIYPSSSVYIITSSIVSVTSASWASSSLTASFALNGGQGSNLITGSLVPITSSWATNTTTSSFSLSSATSSFFVEKATTLNTGSTYPITASQSVSSSWSPNQGATTLGTGSTYPITASQSVSSSWSPNQGATTLGTGSTYLITSSVAISASFARQSVSASWSTNAYTSSYTPTDIPYTTDLTSSTNWITCSFDLSNQVFNLTTAKAYSFTQSNMPIVGQVSDLLLFINNTANATSSLSFPSNWMNLGSGWPTSIIANNDAVLWLRAIDNNTIVGTYNVSGSQSSASFASTYPRELATGSTYLITSSWSNNSTTASNGAASWGSMNYSGLGGITGSFYNSSVTRGAIGSFNVLFNNALNKSSYAVIASGWSGSISVLPPTASVISSVNQTTTGFTMSISKGFTVAAADFNTASFAVYSY